MTETYVEVEEGVLVPYRPEERVALTVQWPDVIEGVPVAVPCDAWVYLPGDGEERCELRAGHRDEWHEATWTIPAHGGDPDKAETDEVVMRWRRMP